MADDLDPAAVERVGLGDYLADLADVGPDTPVDLTRPEYALAMLVTSAHPDWQYLGERVFAALTAAGQLVTPEEEQPATPLSDLIESARRWHDPEADTEGPAVSVADLVAALPEHDAQVAARALRKAAEVIDGAEVYDELAAPNLDGVRWTEECVHGAVAESGPITDWLRRRADRIERQEGGR